MKNKRGVTMSSWTEGIMLSLLIVIILGIGVVAMNGKYNQSNSIGLGTEALQDFKDSQDSLQNSLDEGEAGFRDDGGLTLSSSWNIIKASGNIIFEFITGGWVNTITTNYMGLPSEVGLVFRILFFLSVGYIILRILFKITP